jgi:hypothetical protein
MRRWFRSRKTRARFGDRSGQSLTEYLLLIFLVVTVFVTVVRVLGPILKRIARQQGRVLERRFGEGVYQYRFPGQ